ncbi:DegT/DnrJ/EryC1/StrS family aminotransferase [Auraticoccus monumenti]|uniref:dTDP-4-amino-4,6-dideoxygalactose transaminase n=1 Tax=Auraticoccus monumenti TaxID=675864 RepID=A0A1G6RET3_9ACTN|nr:aminotransferase class I/II-fold pyridoxal phosphate-dependent enzyme [Auraticoccus monumenti]SDD02951.1 dTDP-4-amino-4,6-dideoxygalactose transaminase [Auraticoccus monumenti]SDE70833.1 dTDP-4-amino-4,6-dideoxygalactose transaminase [Auraticoccus monumenti]
MNSVPADGDDTHAGWPERIYLSPPDVGVAEEAAVIRAIRSGWVAPLGPDVDAFEQELAQATGRKHAVALSSGTAALHLSLLNLGVGPGDVVITASMTFAATANAITYTGATPVFVDSDVTGCIDPDLLASALEDQVARRGDVAAIVPVDLLGQVADYRRIDEVAAQHGVPVVADAAESFGARRGGRPAGSAGVAAALSFNGNKIMTTSGGGALVTDNEEFAARARYLATQARQPLPHYEHIDIGYNYRLSNLLAALGRAQLVRLESMIQRRRSWRRHYGEVFAHVDGVRILGATGWADESVDRDNYWLTCIMVDPVAAGWSTQELHQWLTERNIEARPMWKPMHQQPVFAAAPSYITGVSDAMFATGLSLPSGSALTEAQFDRITCSISEFLRRVPRR